MKLINKITYWFIGIVFLITPFTMYISYTNIKKKIDEAEVERMKDVNERVAEQLKSGEKPDRYALGRPISITPVQGPLPVKQTEVTEANFYNEDIKRRECRLTVSSFYMVNETPYRISSYNYVTKSDQILSGMINALVIKLLLIILSVGITARLLSRYVLYPFRQTMKIINNFDIKKKDKIELPATTTREFKELNTFLEKMTEKAMEDYASVKEFSENASHELQTPLAVIRSKLELLAETDIDACQASLIADTQNAIDKLSKINRSLTLLTRLDNHEFATSDDIKICRITKDVLAVYEDWIAHRGLQVRTDLCANVPVRIHPTLAEMLLNNLLSNAIRHNIEQGMIEIRLTPSRLTVINTGLPPEIPTEELFLRFKKSNQSADSIGLGLAIVKQICEVNQFDISYAYQQGQHIINIHFNVAENTAPQRVTGGRAAVT
ncbi:sensor histidine kinase [Taibaiella chishuiensis]|uniref:histidine kinase n=1 Tax=Taibaiella chishuiensis TaxID=1434707 RepID=A0A2P8D2I1_9BACT|nr:HAMP domain-containing sensor histidine kinase [Taibaiella chishuiensis]PSK91434.1 signal transduction histidine kinase [Taibaiella chishuiensis]